MRTVEILSEMVTQAAKVFVRGDVVEMKDEDALPLVVCKAARFVDNGAPASEVVTPTEDALTPWQLECTHPADECIPALSMGHARAVLCRQCGARVENGVVIGSEV